MSGLQHKIKQMRWYELGAEGPGAHLLRPPSGCAPGCQVWPAGARACGVIPFAQGQIGQLRESSPGLPGETQSVVGKHESPRSRRAHWAAFCAVVAIVVVLLASGVAWAVLNAQSGTDESTDSGKSTVSTRTTSTRSTSSSPTHPATKPPTAPSDAALTKAQRALVTCRADLAARERLAQAAAASARDWGMHTGAQIKLDSGAWTLAQAKAAWAASKARGASDIRQFAAAMTAVTNDSGATGCRSVMADTAPTELAAQGRSCASRDRALSAVASTGGVVHSQWAAHLAMMADKTHTDAGAYHNRWVTMVAQAQTPLQRYAAAATALSRAPLCSA